MGFSDRAKPARAAGSAPRHDDVVALFHIRDALADGFDDAASLMPEQKGKP